MVPDRTKRGIDRYVKKGIDPGDFLKAVLSNNLLKSFEKADLENVRKMHDIVKYIYNEVPIAAWGNEQIVNEWMDRGGLNGDNES